MRIGQQEQVDTVMLKECGKPCRSLHEAHRSLAGARKDSTGEL